MYSNEIQKEMKTKKNHFAGSLRPIKWMSTMTQAIKNALKKLATIPAIKAVFVTQNVAIIFHNAKAWNE